MFPRIVSVIRCEFPEHTECLSQHSLVVARGKSLGELQEHQGLWLLGKKTLIVVQSSSLKNHSVVVWSCSLTVCPAEDT